MELKHGASPFSSVAVLELVYRKRLAERRSFAQDMACICTNFDLLLFAMANKFGDSGEVFINSALNLVIYVFYVYFAMETRTWRRVISNSKTCQGKDVNFCETTALA
jgi:hypothetical protein